MWLLFSWDLVQAPGYWSSLTFALYKNILHILTWTIDWNFRYGSPPHVDERHRHRYEVCHQFLLLNILLVISFMCIVIICLELITCSFLFIIGQSLFCSHAWKCWSSFCWLWRKSKADGGTKQIAYAILGSWISFSKAWTCLHLWADCGATRSSLLCRCSVPPRVQIKASKTFTSFYRWKPFLLLKK